MFTFILDHLILTLYSIDNCMPRSVPAWFNDACWNRWDDLDAKDYWCGITKHESRVLHALSQLHQI